MQTDQRFVWGKADECIEWQVTYGYQKFHEFLIKIQTNT